MKSDEIYRKEQAERQAKRLQEAKEMRHKRKAEIKAKYSSVNISAEDFKRIVKKSIDATKKR